VSIELDSMANVVSVDSVSSGLRYGEIVFVSGTSAINSFPLDLGATKNNPPDSGSAVSQPGFGYRKNGKIIVNGDQVGLTESVLAPGDVVMVAINLTSLKAWIGRNGTWVNSGDPVAGTGQVMAITAGTWYLGASAYQPGTTEELTATLRTQASQFTQSIPNGFSAWYP
jgi:hypothetical protein